MTNATTAPDWTPGQQATHAGHVVTLGTWSGAANHTPRALGHRCGDEWCRRFDLDHGFAWECELQPLTRAEHAGQVIMRLTAHTTGTYSVTAEYASVGRIIPELTAAYVDPRVALAAYNDGVFAFAAGMTVEQALSAVAAAQALPQLHQRAERRAGHAHQAIAA